VRVTGLGHAGLRVETGGATLLIDPWFSPEGAFLGSWFPYPDNSHLLAPALFQPTAIVISHEHLDHVDPWFLSRVPAAVPVIIPRYPAAALREKILMGGPRPIVEADQWERIAVGSGTTVFFVSEPPMNHDSAIIVEGDGHTLLDLNDARLFPVQLREIRGRVGGVVDMFAFQGAGASWYPICYRYPADKAAVLSRRKRMAKFAYCYRAMGVVEPIVGLPFAGPPAFLDTTLFQHNAEMDGGIFPDQQQAANWLAGRRLENIAVLLPGDQWDGATRAKTAHSQWAEFTFENRRPYLQAYAEKRRPQLETVLNRHPEPTSSLWPEFRDYFERLLTLSQYFNERISMRVGFEVRGDGGGSWAVDFRTGSRGVYREAGDCGYVYTFDARWLPTILAGHTPWEDFFLSLRFEARAVTRTFTTITCSAS
jgi:UDP-MurNAc hydroxylase